MDDQNFRTKIEDSKLFLNSITPKYREVGNLLYDQNAVWKFGNQINVLYRALSICKENNIKVGHSPLKPLCEVLDYSALEDHPVRQVRWAVLLSNMVDSERDIEFSQFPFILNQITDKGFDYLKTVFFNNQDRIQVEMEKYYSAQEEIEVLLPDYEKEKKLVMELEQTIKINESDIRANTRELNTLNFFTNKNSKTELKKIITEVKNENSVLKKRIEDNFISKMRILKRIEEPIALPDWPRFSPKEAWIDFLNRGDLLNLINLALVYSLPNTKFKVLKSKIGVQFFHNKTSVDSFVALDRFVPHHVFDEVFGTVELSKNDFEHSVWNIYYVSKLAIEFVSFVCVKNEIMFPISYNNDEDEWELHLKNNNLIRKH